MNKVSTTNENENSEKYLTEKYREKMKKLLLDLEKDQKVKNYYKQKSEKLKVQNLIRKSKSNKVLTKRKMEEFLLYKKSLNLKTVSIKNQNCLKLFRAASRFEKERKIDNYKNIKHRKEMKLKEKQQILLSVENYYKDQISQLKDHIFNQKFDKQIANYAQTVTISNIIKEIKDLKQKQFSSFLDKAHKQFH